MGKKSNNTTPLMEQYLSIKAEYKDVLLLYRMGDFYETFYDDAKNLAKTLGIALTKRAHGKSADVPLAGFPYHALDNYLPKLLGAGLRVAICEQVEDPKLAKGVVKREVIEIASPGATLSDKLLDSRRNNFLLAVTFENEICGLAIADVSTGSLQAAEFPPNILLEQLIRYQPKEILIARRDAEKIKILTRNHLSTIFTERDDWIFTRDYTYNILREHFSTHSLKGFGIDDMAAGVIASGVIIHYLQENYKTRLEHFHKLQVLNLSKFMVLDESTRRNLEIAETITGSDKNYTLLNVLDLTVTPMGARLFKQWLQQPLLDKKEIDHRFDIVEELYENRTLREELTSRLKELFDMERLLGKIVTGRANARDLLNLKQSLELVEPVKNEIETEGSDRLKSAFGEFNSLKKLTGKIDAAITDNPPLTIQEGGIIRRGYNEELDELRDISEKGKDWLIKYQEEERKKTSINTLKINYNKVFGYYIEVTNVHKDKVPDYYIRKQTLVNAERYITPDLKEWEEKILGAEDKINDLEYRIFQDIRKEVSNYIEPVQNNSRLFAELDYFLRLTAAAFENDYIRPVIADTNLL
ncbi:MAG: DNA mismatch repair protein MutS, partial [Calditrichaceae bacterium]